MPWLWHGFSTRRGGVSRAYLPSDAEPDSAGELNLGFTSADTEENVRENRLRLAEAVTGRREMPLITVRQIHSSRSVVIQASNAGEQIGFATGEVPEADGMLSNKPGFLLGIQTADCIPVLIADPVNRAVGAFHAGWRGTASRVVELGVAQMRAEFGSDPAKLVAAIGPGIGVCCYVIGEELRREFESQFDYAGELFLESAGNRGPVLSLDLMEANRRQLLAACVESQAIGFAGGCTSCHPELFYSHRASGGHAGRMMTVIGVRG